MYLTPDPVARFRELLQAGVVRDDQHMVGGGGVWHLPALTGCFFSGPPPPKKFEYKIPLYPLALREISDQLTWDLVL